MDFSSRNNQSNQSVTAPARPAAPAVSNQPRGSKGSKFGGPRWFRGAALVMLIAVGVILVAVIALVAMSNDNKSEDSFVSNKQLQAVFLTNDQVYFGNISTLNSKYLVLDNIYYLQTQNANSTAQTTAANSNVSLVKLGCELHKPTDQMVINRTQVQFWENLQGDGQVANAVAQFKKANPNGQKCSTTGSNGATTGNVQGGATGTPNATPTPNTDNGAAGNTSTTKKP